mmetsp:Transcript_1252/g.1108  ORF Transcript_1252/g.1108 Transcript_1252/m.1108 type:complete len:113 (+) Transcript_1252:184-522(+)
MPIRCRATRLLNRPSILVRPSASRQTQISSQLYLVWSTNLRIFCSMPTSVPGTPPLQMMFALKEFNAGKLDTHLWFFEGFAHHIYRVMNARASEGVHEELYCVCLDAEQQGY